MIRTTKMVIAGILFAVTLLAAEDAVSIPRTMNFQGKLTDSTGGVRNGDFSMTFRIYDQATGGTLIWTEDHTAGNRVHVTAGLFNVLLGRLTPITGLPDSSFLEMEVEGEVVAPRVSLASSPYSFYSNQANTAGQAANSDSLGHAAASGYVRNVIANTPLSSSGGQYPILSLATSMSGDLSGSYPSPAVAGLQNRPLSATAPGANQVLAWDGSSWAPADAGSGSNYWTISAPYIYPSQPSSGNSGVRAYTTGQNYNLYAQTNATNQYGVYGYSSQDPSYGVAGVNQYYSVNGILGYGYQNLNGTPKIYPAGVRGDGGANGDGVFGQTNGQLSLGLIGRNNFAAGTGAAGLGNNATGLYVAAVGSGGAFTGTKMGVFGKAATTWSSFNMTGGYFEALDLGSAQTSYAYVAAWAASGAGYRCNGSGSCAGGYLTRDGERTMVSVEMPEARVEDIGRGRLVHGHARIELDPLFADCVLVSDAYPLDVFVQLQDDCNGVYVQADARGFDVNELRGGRSSARFSYRVVAYRQTAGKNAQPARFAPALPHTESRLDR
jgi:hypothetical protein